MGDDARVSIRGSGLSRAYGTRGLAMYFDGIPLNTSDGLLDFFEIDPSAYSYVEVFKGATALRYGSDALGGEINLVTPTRSEERRVGKECVSPCRSRWWTYHEKHNKKISSQQSLSNTPPYITHTA